MRTIDLTESSTIEVISAFVAPQAQIDAVAAEPGWYVLGSFFVPVSTQGRLEAIGYVSAAGVTLRFRLFDFTAAQAVSGSTVEVTDLVETRAVSGSVDVVGGHVYQVQAEAIGPSGFGVLKSATLV